MSEARQRHVGKTEQERQDYLNRLKGGGTTSGTSYPHAATDELPDNRYQRSPVPTHRPTPAKQNFFDQVKENIGSILIGCLATAVISGLGYLFVKYENLNREVGEIKTSVQSQATVHGEAIKRIERKIDSAVKNINERLSRSETRLDRHFEGNSHHSSP